jgi:hypothetical protein
MYYRFRLIVFLIKKTLCEVFMIKISQPHRPFTLTNLILLLILGFILNLFTGCASGQPLQKPSEPIQLGDVLVLPFQNLHQTCGIDISFRCPFVGAVYEINMVNEGAADFLTENLFSRLQSRKDLSLIDPQQALGARSAVLAKSTGELSEKELILETARTAGADSVIVGRIFRYRERVGTAFSVDTPASVAFDILLIRVSDGQLLWVGRFNETQKSLFENLFWLGKFINRSARWLTADELGDSGLAEVLKSFPDSF